MVRRICSRNIWPKPKATERSTGAIGQEEGVEGNTKKLATEPVLKAHRFSCQFLRMLGFFFMLLVVQHLLYQHEAPYKEKWA